MFGREKAKLDGFELELDGIKDLVEKDLHEHEFPFKDGAFIEDMGAGAREISFKCFFYGSRYAEHYKFYDHVCKTGDILYELEHPTYGLVLGKIRSVAITRNDAQETAEIDVAFVEELQGTFSIMAPPQVNVVKAIAEAAYQAGQIQHLAESATDILAAIGTEAQDMINTVIDPATSLANSFIDASLAARQVLNIIDDALDAAEGILSSVTIPVNEVTSLVEYPSTMPGRIVSATARVAARYAESIANVANVPENYINNLASSFQGCAAAFNDDIFPFKKQVLISCAQMLALKSAARYSEDEERRCVVRQVEKLSSFDMAGRYLNPPEMPRIMNVLQLEQTLSTVRSLLQAAITAARSITALKEMARALLDHVYNVKLETENIIIKTYTRTIPLCLICAREGLSYNYAERVFSLNAGVRNPTFTIGDVRMYA